MVKKNPENLEISVFDAIVQNRVAFSVLELDELRPLLKEEMNLVGVLGVNSSKQ